NKSDTLPALASTGWEFVPESIVNEYVTAVSQFLDELSPTTQRSGLNIVYTPMHGVGAGAFCQLMSATGVDTMALLDQHIAHDPDADRLAVAVPVDGEWHRLSGDHIGLLLGARLMPYLATNGLVLANSVVSAPQLAKLAGQAQLKHRVTPTGFKWICRVDN